VDHWERRARERREAAEREHARLRADEDDEDDEDELALSGAPAKASQQCPRCGHAFEAAWRGWKFKPLKTVRATLSLRGQPCDGGKLPARAHG
jgi:hypothetical protein